MRTLSKVAPLGLLQALACAAEVVVVRVTTADELHRAIGDGAVHIEVTEHLNITGLRPADSSDPQSALLQPGPELQSITVRPRLAPFARCTVHIAQSQAQHQGSRRITKAWRCLASTM
jgi:hypothetical protein